MALPASTPGASGDDASITRPASTPGASCPASADASSPQPWIAGAAAASVVMSTHAGPEGLGVSFATSKGYHDDEALAADTKSANQPTIMPTPPNGVTAPNARTPVKVIR